VSGKARVSGDAQVSGKAWVFGDARVQKTYDHILSALSAADRLIQRFIETKKKAFAYPAVVLVVRLTSLPPK
jgi:hypothetical protein